MSQARETELAGMPTGMNHWPCTKTEMTEMVFHVSLHHRFLLTAPAPAKPGTTQTHSYVPENLFLGQSTACT